uniref:Roadblock/LAMTOR2 domain-containing protein n=1 Tax=Phaeomonas parva TaxID=124430 RepID=A0A7S1TSR5_9STRA|mmetsp:Transcript_16203/g.49512  ORF Transcript_16203/g.49512 Transcript_16203/m.49512 type:complete len:126 (+) Transcript_16203:213-590(+)|eukprot:CAMPEP_0118868662 /NCGR_PEP_ID=MMETSP1163-20130328/12137_1 /TAXON_ID=124430 /ORGANISM="Phaeomonas parva, Strain CCMP2877" /LENGTH=125 /DNA_ID=CAMNT_0006803405 /DNA_START=277 /DNA_END=654 /DNA_ORIENTATION=-
MLRVAAIPRILEQINTDGVKGSALVTMEGALLGYAGEMLPDVKAQVFGAVSSSMWDDFDEAGTNGTGELDMLFLSMDNGQLAIARAGPQFLVCAYAMKACGTGILRAKLKAISDYLADSLGALGS